LRRFSIGGAAAFSFFIFVCSNDCRGDFFREDTLREDAFWEGTPSAVPRSFAKTSALAPEVSGFSIATITTQSANRIPEGVTPATPQPQPTTCDTLRAAKSKVYGLRPTQLSESQIDAKGKEIAAFWKQVHSAGSDGVSCVRSMLRAETTDHFFQFDAASFLYQADRSPETLLLVRDSIAQADFQESDPANYLSLAVALAQQGVDIGPLAARLLRYPNAVIRVPEQGLELDSDTAALFLYGSMKPSVATNALMQAPESFVRAGAAHLLAEQLTEESFRTLSRCDGLRKIEEEFRRNEADFAHLEFSREQVLQTIASLPRSGAEFTDVMGKKGAEFDKCMRDSKATQEQISTAIAEGEPIYGIANHTAFMNSAVATLQPGDFELLRTALRKALFNVSDHSLEEYLAFTQVMIGLINRLDLYKEFRFH
jgi:hypothetical protein